MGKPDNQTNSDMVKSISSAKALHTFFSGLPKPAGNRSTTTLTAIADKYSLATNSVELLEIIHVQRSNLISLIQALEATAWPAETKKASRQPLNGLLQAIDHQGLLKDWKDTRIKFVSPNLNALLILEQSLQIQGSLTVEQERDVEEIAEKLDGVLKEVAESELPPPLRAKIVSSLSVLVLLLKNYKIVGVARAWEVASSTLLALSLEAQDKPEAKFGVFKKVMKVLASGVSVLALVNGFVSGSEDLLPKVAAAVRHVGSLFQQNQKLLEHKPTANQSDEADEHEADSKVD